EITIMHQPHVELSGQEIKKNLIYPEKGYAALEGVQKGWYLPEVHNAKRFINLSEFLESLGTEKAHINSGHLQNAKAFIFEVDDFIESENQQESLSLFGPVVQSKIPDSRFQILDSHLRAAADWL